MILVDSSIWIDHLHAADALLSGLIERGEVLTHPFVIGEIAIGAIRSRAALLASLAELPKVSTASDHDVMYLIERHRLFSRGLGYIDAHLIAAARLQPGTSLWTRDRGLHAVANELGLAAHFAH